MTDIKRHEPKKILANAVEAGGLVFLAGQCAPDLSADAAGQTRQILDEIDRLLALAGSDKSKAVSATIWVSDIRYRDPMNEVWVEWIDSANIPARACIEAKLADPRALVEIAVIAAK